MTAVAMNRFAGLIIVVVLATATIGPGLAQAVPVEGVSEKLDANLISDHDRRDQDLAVIVHITTAGTLLKSHGSVPEDRLLSIASLLDPIVEDIRREEGMSDPRPFLLQAAMALKVTPEGLDTLLDRSDVRFVERDDTWPVHTAEGISIIGADVLQLFGFTGDNTAIAIIDTGIDPHHPSLGGGDIPNTKVVRGLDTADGDDDPLDCSGHGTAVASIAAGASFQWSPDRTFAGGVAPAARLMAYKAASDSDCSVLLESAVIAAIEDAVLHREDDAYTLVAINISGGGGSWNGPCDEDNPAMAAAVHSATTNGIAVVTSSGNNGLANGITSPACLEETISVGSVWDQKATAFGSLFCLDETCSSLCSDQFKLATEATCYSNSGRILDLLAPSEYLRVAEAGGQITTFGGTSGAAPYVSGAIALLHRAFPYLHPAHLRLILMASGNLRTGPSGARPIPLVNVLNALGSGDLTFGDAINLHIPGAGQPPLRSLTDIQEWGPVGNVRVWIRLNHPTPSALIISLSDPAGNVIRLWDGPKTPDAAPGLFGCFPIDLEPTESLNSFIGLERHGQWELTLENIDPDGVSATLQTWALQVTDLEPPLTALESFAATVPVIARGPGVNDTLWSTGIRVFNHSTLEPAEIGLYLIQEGHDGTVDFKRRPLFIPAGHSLDLDDVVGSTFNLNAAAGQLLLESNVSDLIVGGRIQTPDPGGGTFGQFVAGSPPTLRPSTMLLHLSENSDFRTNFGLSESSGSEATASITLFDAHTGDKLSENLHLEVPPFSIQRIDRLLPTSGGPPAADFYAIVETNSAVTPWASVVDNRTGDAVFIPGTNPVAAGSFMLPVVARTPGHEETLWRTDVSIASTSTEPLSVTLELRRVGENESEILIATLPIAPGTVALLDDVVATVFGLETAIGSLRIIPDPRDAPIAAVSRTYNKTDSGTYGQFIPAVSEGVTTVGTIIHIDGSAQFRTNLFLCEIGGAQVLLELRLRDQQGTLLGEPQIFELQPFQMFQIVDVFRSFNVQARSNCRFDLRLIDGAGSFTALASVVDQTTGDAITVPLVE
ncbi:MAG: S8 family serine peptidase [Thermoanaerobaculales bacterium]|nr:S8 family serine peptidase [Thermoanaerobaculales bacterium]